MVDRCLFPTLDSQGERVTFPAETTYSKVLRTFSVDLKLKFIRKVQVTPL